MFNKDSPQKRGVITGHSFKKLLQLTFLCMLSMLNIDTSGFFASAAITAGYDKMSQSCKEKIFPLSSGGSKNEFVSCTVYDAKNQQIIVGGNSTSEDYAPAANEHAFVYAVDMEGNWKWGKFYYNVSYAVSTISGCSMDGNGLLMVFN